MFVFVLVYTIHSIFSDSRPAVWVLWVNWFGPHSTCNGSIGIYKTRCNCTKSCTMACRHFSTQHTLFLVCAIHWLNIGAMWAFDQLNMWFLEPTPSYQPLERQTHRLSSTMPHAHCRLRCSCPFHRRTPPVVLQIRCVCSTCSCTTSRPNRIRELFACPPALEGFTFNSRWKNVLAVYCIRVWN